MEPNHENACEQYLLGELSEQEQAQLEEAYFSNDALFERFLAVKDELIDAYARGELKGEKRERFEQHFMASQPRRQRVEEAREFIRAVTAASADVTTAKAGGVLVQSADSWWRQLSSTPVMFRPWVLRGAIAVLVVVALGGSWALIKQRQSQRANAERLKNEQALLKQQEEERSRVAAPPVNVSGPTAGPDAHASPPAPASPENTQPKSIDRQPPQPIPVHIASISLSTFSPRDATASNSLLLRPETRVVHLHLAFSGDAYRTYHVLLRTPDGDQVLSRHGLKARPGPAGKSLTLIFAPSVFKRQDYIITLSGLAEGGQREAIGDYYFRVEQGPSQSATPTRQ